MRNVVSCLLLLSVARADPATRAADEILELHAAGGPLQGLAARDDPDPWLVADELCARGEHDAAEAFAKATSRRDTERLPAYVAARRKRPAEVAARKALAAARKAALAKDPEAVLAAVAGVDDAGDDTVVAVRLLHGRAYALRSLDRPEESARTFLVAGDVAARLGWLARAAALFRESAAGASHTSDLRAEAAAWERCRAVEESRGDHAAVAMALRKIGELQGSLGEHAKALGSYRRLLALMETLEDRDGVATALREIGRAHQSLGDHGEALEIQQRCLALMRALGSRDGVAQVLTDIGNTYHLQSECREALEHYEAALELWEALDRGVDVARTLTNIADVHRLQGDHPKALAVYRRALTLSRQIGDRPREASALLGLGRIHARLGEHAEARERLESALAFRDTMSERDFGTLLRNLGQLLYDQRRYAEALERFREAARTLERESKQGHANALLGAGYALNALGRHEEALALYTKIQRIYEEIGDERNLGVLAGHQASAYERIGAYARAVECYRRSLEIARSTGDGYGVVWTLGALGFALMKQGGLEDAADACGEALRLARAQGFPNEVVVNLGRLSVIEKERGNLAEALALSEQAAALDPRPDLLYNLATCEYQLGNHDRARDRIREGRERAEATGDTLCVMRGDALLAWLEDAVGRSERVPELLEEPLRFYEETGNRRMLANGLSLLANSHMRTGRLEDALAVAQRILSLDRERGATLDEAWVHARLARIHLLRGELDRARAAGRRALALARDAGSRAAVFRSWDEIAAVAYAGGRLDEVLVASRAAVAEIPFLTGGLADLESSRLRSADARLFERATTAALRLGDTEALYDFLEKGRAGAFLEAMGGREVVAAAVLPEELVAAERKARAEENEAAAALQRAQASGERGVIRACRDALEAAREGRREVTARIQREEKAAASFVQLRPVALEQTQAALRQDEALVLFTRLASEWSAFVVTRDGKRPVALGATAPIDEAIEAVRAPDPAEPVDHEAVALLRSRLIEALCLPEEVRRVMVSADGALHLLSFSLLSDRREFVMVPSASSYVYLRETCSARGEGVLALGDPDYGRKPRPQARAILRSGASLARLPASGVEASRVGDRALLRRDATETNLVAGLAERRWHAVHLACHGLVRTDHPELSALALAPDDENDGLLTVLDISRLEVAADLVALSACDTARGKIYAAEGAVGLPRAFLLAGAPRVICSLWKVDDEATRALMVRFYESWKTRPAATALREAQDFVRSHEKWRHPYYWAAWQLWGLPE